VIELRPKNVVDNIIYPEGIRWGQGKVWFSDILDSTVYCFDTGWKRLKAVVRLDDRPSGLGFLPDGTLLIATMRERKLLRFDRNGLRLHADLGGACDLLNDMVTDARGRSYVDSHFDAGAGSGGIILVEPDGSHRVVASGMKTPNGLAVTADSKKLIVNDLFDNRIFAFDIADEGGLENQRIFADLGDRSPDGICLDAEGAVWVGLPFQGKFQRIRQGGEVTHEIPCGSKWGIAPVLGGADRRTLFLCTAEVSLEAMPRLIQDPANARNECKGWIEAVETIEVPGAGYP
jgi:sugar lactone lactonase YvrE